MSCYTYRTSQFQRSTTPAFAAFNADKFSPVTMTVNLNTDVTDQFIKRIEVYSRLQLNEPGISQRFIGDTEVVADLLNTVQELQLNVGSTGLVAFPVFLLPADSPTVVLDDELLKFRNPLLSAEFICTAMFSNKGLPVLTVNPTLITTICITIGYPKR